MFMIKFGSVKFFEIVETFNVFKKFKGNKCFQKSEVINVLGRGNKRVFEISEVINFWRFQR